MKEKRQNIWWVKKNFLSLQQNPPLYDKYLGQLLKSSLEN